MVFCRRGAADGFVIGSYPFTVAPPVAANLSAALLLVGSDLVRILQENHDMNSRLFGHPAKHGWPFFLLSKYLGVLDLPLLSTGFSRADSQQKSAIRNYLDHIFSGRPSTEVRNP